MSEGARLWPRGERVLVDGLADVRGRRLPGRAKPKRTAFFQTQQDAIRTRRRQGDKQAARLDDEILAAIAHLADNPCIGFRMRGVPVLEGLCSYHFRKPLRRWRLIYRHLPGQGEVQLILLGEHWKYAAGPGGRGGSSAVGSRRRFDDVYDAVATFHGGSSKVERRKIARAVRVQEKERCC